MPNKPWTQEETNLLLSNKKVPTRSKKAIHRKLTLLGLVRPKYKIACHSKKRWTEEEISLLKQNKVIKGRTKNSIRSMILKLNLKNKNKHRARWKKKEETLLKKLVAQKETAKTIFAMNVFSYSKNSIQKKMCRMGLARVGPRYTCSKEDKEKFKNFLIKNWVSNTPKELMNKWNKENKNKVSKSKVVYHLSKLKIKIPYSEVLKINNQKKKEETIRNNFHKSAKILEEKIRMSRVEIMQSRILKGRDIWTGLPSDFSLEDFLKEESV